MTDIDTEKEQHKESSDDGMNVFAHDTDTQFSSEEQQLHSAFAPQTHSIKDRLVRLWRCWWTNKPVRYGTIGGVIVLIGIIFLIPGTRYASLNLVGVRGSVQLMVLDKTSGQPLQNVQVQLDGTVQKTSQKGVAVLNGIKLGTQEVAVRKDAFASEQIEVMVTMGRTEVPDVSLRPIGSQYTFVVTDYVSGKPITGAKITSAGDASANVNKKGEALLTLTATNDGHIPITVSSESYRSEKKLITPGNHETQNVTLVPAAQHVFASNQSGVLGIYAIDIDGKNRKELLSPVDIVGQQSVQLRTNSGATLSALVSKKDAVKNKDGYILDALSILTVSSATNKTIDRGEDIQIIDWSGDELVYTVVVSGASAANAQRSKLFSYNTRTDKKTQLAATNYFVGAIVIGDIAYYATSSTDPGQSSALLQIGLDGKNRQLLSRGSMWSLYRSSYTNIALQNEAGWQNYDTKIHKLSTLSMPQYEHYRFETSPDATKTAYVQQRDGKGVLVVSDLQRNRDVVLTVLPGAETVRWLTNNVLVYRSSTDREVADYVVSIDSGSAAISAKKVTDAVRAY